MATGASANNRHRAESPGPEPDRQRRLTGLTPVSLFFVLLLFWVLTQIQLVLILGLLALLFGTILEGPVQRLESQRIPRPAAIALIYVVIIGGLALLVFLIAPVIGDQADNFQEQIPAQLRELEAEWSASSNPILSGPGDQLLQRAIDFLDEPGDAEVPAGAAQRAIPVITSIGTTLVSTLTLFVITFYYLMEKALIRRVIISQLNPSFQPRVNRIWEDVENKVGGWMRGQLVLCLIIGTIATVSYGIVGLDFWPLLGLWAGLTEIIPIIGPWIGGIPAFIVALTIGWETALITVGIIVAMQSLENWVLVPRVMRGAVGLTPLTVFLAILAGTQLMGIIGAVLAIPIAATIQVILTDYLNTRRGRHEQSAVSGWRWMLSRAGIRDDDGSEYPDGSDGEDGTNDQAQIESGDMRNDAQHDPRRVSSADRDDPAAAEQGPSPPTVPASNAPPWKRRESSRAEGSRPKGWAAMRRDAPSTRVADDESPNQHRPDGK